MALVLARARTRTSCSRRWATAFFDDLDVPAGGPWVEQLRAAIDRAGRLAAPPSRAPRIWPRPGCCSATPAASSPSRRSSQPAQGRLHRSSRRPTSRARRCRRPRCWCAEEAGAEVGVGAEQARRGARGQAPRDRHPAGRPVSRTCVDCADRADAHARSRRRTTRSASTCSSAACSGCTLVAAEARASARQGTIADVTRLSGNLLAPPTRLPVDPATRAARPRRRPDRGRGRAPDVVGGLGRAGRGRAGRRAVRSRPTPTPAPATTAGSTRCAGPAGRDRARCPGRTRRTRASCARCTRSARRPARSASRTKPSAAPSSWPTATPSGQVALTALSIATAELRLEHLAHARCAAGARPPAPRAAACAPTARGPRGRSAPAPATAVPTT